MYKVRPYLINSFTDDQSIVQTGTSTVIVNSALLRTFLYELEEQSIETIDEDIMENSFGSNASIVIEFLLENKIITPVVSPSMGYNRVHLLYNDYSILDLAKMVFPETVSNFSINEINDEIIAEAQEDDLFFIYLNPLELSRYASITEQLSRKGSIIKFFFFYNHSLYISNYYQKRWANPCPKCFFYSLESQLRGIIPGDGSPTFQTIIDLIYTKQPQFATEAKLNRGDLLLPIQYIINDIKHGDPNHFINDAYEIDLNTGRVRKDKVYHWELCDCYE